MSISGPQADLAIVRSSEFSLAFSLVDPPTYGQSECEPDPAVAAAPTSRSLILSTHRTQSVRYQTIKALPWPRPVVDRPHALLQRSPRHGAETTGSSMSRARAGRADAPSGGRWNDAAWIAVVLASDQYCQSSRRHWLHDNCSRTSCITSCGIASVIGLADPCLESRWVSALAEPQVQALYLFTALWPIADPSSVSHSLLLHAGATIGMYVLRGTKAGSDGIGGRRHRVGRQQVHRIVHPCFCSASLTSDCAPVSRTAGVAPGITFICCAMQVLSGHQQMAVYTFIAAVVITAGRRVMLVVFLGWLTLLGSWPATTSAASLSRWSKSRRATNSIHPRAGDGSQSCVAGVSKDPAVNPARASADSRSEYCFPGSIAWWQ